MSGAGIKRAIGIAAGLFVLAGPLSGQSGHDVIMRGRMNDTPIPDHVREWLKQNPRAGLVRHGWKSAVREARSVRAQMRRQGVRPTMMSSRRRAVSGAAVSGTFRVPVLTVTFENTASEPYPSDDLEEKLYSGPSPTITLTEFYSEISRGVFTLTGDVLDWVGVSEADTFYAGSTNGLGGDAQIGDLLVEALDSADLTVDFSIYDSDGDGFVDFAAFVHPEIGGECGGNSNIWSHRFVVEAWTGEPYQTNDGVKVQDYVIQPALRCDGTMIEIGVFAHEYGHALGLPDLYDTNPDNGTSEGIGHWGLMGSGNYNDRNSPAHMMAWSKAFLGWMPVVEVTSDTSVALQPAELAGVALRLNVPESPGEYFLLENRQPIGSDQYVHGGGGLLVWHVDSTALRSSLNGDEEHKGIDLEAADGQTDMDDNTNRGDGGDPFPGSMGNVSFSDATNPNSRGYSGDASYIALTGIQQVGSNMEFGILIGSAYWGDVTMNDVIEVNDAEAIFAELVGDTTGANMLLADVDGDGDVDVRDGLIVHSFAIGVDLSACAECRAGDEVSPGAISPPTITLRKE